MALPGLERSPGPFLRWAGGKTRLLKSILPHVPTTLRNYHEPFVGGGAVFYAVRERIEGTAYLSDLNQELVGAWLAVRDHTAELLAELEHYRGKDTEAEYYEVRATNPTDPIQRAAWFLYLNQTAWNGLWRVNRWGEFNVPWGARDFRGFDPEALNAVAGALADVSIECSDFRAVLKRAEPGDFVYLDPPYLPVSDTSKFSGYTQKRFRAADLRELAEACSDLSGKGVAWVLSNRDTELVRELFSGERIVRMTTRRSVAAQNKRDVEPANSPEVIVVGGRGT